MRKHEKAGSWELGAWRGKTKVLRICLIMVMLGQSLFLSGCWDMVELEDRGFALGIALDKSEKEGEVLITYQIALPSAMYGEGGGEGEKIVNISTSAPNITLGNKQVLTMLNRVLNIEHLQIFILGEELAKEGINQHLDFFFRDINMRRRTDVIVAEGKAKDIFEVTPLTALSTSHYLADLMRLNEKRMYRISSNVDLLEIAKNVRSESDYMVAKVEKSKEDIIVSGAAVFKRGSLVGYLDAEDTSRAKWMINDMDEGIILLKDIGNIRGEAAFNVSEAKTTIKPIIKDDKVNFEVSIRTEGTIAEMEDIKTKGTVSPDFIEALEKAVEAAIKKDCIDIMNKAQYEMEADFLNLGHLVKQYNNRWWNEHEDEWREIFKESKLELKVEAYVRRVGLTK